MSREVGHRYVTQLQFRVRLKGETMKELPAGVKGPLRYFETPATPLPPPSGPEAVGSAASWDLRGELRRAG